MLPGRDGTLRWTLFSPASQRAKGARRRAGKPAREPKGAPLSSSEERGDFGRATRERAGAKGARRRAGKPAREPKGAPLSSSEERGGLGRATRERAGAKGARRRAGKHSATCSGLMGLWEH